MAFQARQTPDSEEDERVLRDCMSLPKAGIDRDAEFTFTRPIGNNRAARCFAWRYRRLLGRSRVVRRAVLLPRDEARPAFASTDRT